MKLLCVRVLGVCSVSVLVAFLATGARLDNFLASQPPKFVIVEWSFTSRWWNAVVSRTVCFDVKSC